MHLLDIESWVELRHFERFKEPVTSVAVLPDGRRALSGSFFSQALHLWDIESGDELYSLRNAPPVTSVAVLPDGHYALVATLYGMHLWDIEKRNHLIGNEDHLARFWGLREPITSVAALPDGRRALLGSLYGTLHLWDIESGRELARFWGLREPITSVAVLPDGLLGSLYGTLHLWDIESGDELYSFKGLRELVTSVAVLPDGRRALSGSYGTLHLWDIESGDELYSFKGLREPVTSVAVLPDGRRALWASDQGLYLSHLSGLPNVPTSEARRAPLASDDASPSETSETVECHFHAEMPGQPKIGLPARVEVTVAREEIDKLSSPTSQQGLATVIDQKSILLQVLPRSNCRTVGEDHALIPVPKAQTQETVVFEVEGISPGAAEVWVEARQGAIQLVLLQLQPVFVPEHSSIISAGGSAAIGLQAREPDHLIVRIYEELLGPNRFPLHFNLDCKTPNINIDTRTREFEFSRESFVAGQYAKLEEAWINDGSDYSRFVGRLRARGIDIYDKLVPENVREALWSHRAQIKAVQVISEEPFIPWEIAYLADPASRETNGEDFLGSFGLVRWLHNIPWPRAELNLRPDKFRFAIPDYPEPRWRLPGAVREADMLQRLFPGAQAVHPRSDIVEKMLQQADGAFDVLHFACHGQADGDKIWDASLMMTGRMAGTTYQPDPLEVAQVYASARLGTDGVRPTSFFNACQVGRTGRSLSGVGGFASAFLSPKSREGAGIFVGTLWSVGDGSALSFATTFYERLQAGDTLVSATRFRCAGPRKGRA